MAEGTALERIKKSLYSPGHDFKVTADYFGQVNVGLIARELNLEKLGEERGSSDLPPVSSKALDEIETQISERLEALKVTASEQAENQALAYNRRIASLDFEGQFGRITQLGPEAVMEFRSEVKDQLNALHIERNYLKDLKNEVNVFRKENRLENKVAYIPTVLHQIIKVLLILLIFVFETVMNGSFFAKGNEAGLFGGTIVAFTITLVNIGFAFLVNLIFVRQLFHVSVIRKFVGIIFLLIFLAFAFCLNIGVGHMREAGAILSTEMGLFVMDKLLLAPFAFNDAETWVLVGIGLLFAFVAGLEGIYWNDPYPRYTFLQSRLNEQSEFYRDTYEDCLQSLNDVKKRILATFQTIGGDLTNRLSGLENVIAQYGKLSNLYDNFQTNLQVASDSLHAIYRDANIEARQGRKFPARWNRNERLNKVSLSKLNQVNRNSLDKKISNIRKELKELIQQIQEEFESGLSQFKVLDELGMETEMNNGSSP